MASSSRPAVPALRRLKQPRGRGAQLRMLPESEMPTESIVPLEKDVVDETRRALKKLGYLTFSGRAAIYDPTSEARDERIARGWPLFLPVFGPGTPDVLGVFPKSGGRLFGLEFKRDLSEKERATQIRWRAMAEAWGIPVQTVRSTDEAIEFLERHRKPLP